MTKFLVRYCAAGILTLPFFSVLLGSFSNYLLSNSSVPVMVARRKLKRHTWKDKLKGTANVRLSNNLITPKSLAQAKVD